MKDFHCRDAGIDCDFVARGNDSKEILAQVGKHAQNAHKMQVTPELSKKVEGLIHGPRRTPDAYQWFGDLHAEPGDQARRPVVRRQVPIPLGNAVEKLERHDRRAQPRIGLGPPHERLQRVHVSLRAPLKRLILAV